MDAFLAEVELRALRMTEFATRNRDDALDIVQDAMFALVRRYANKSAESWRPLFYRILQNGIRDWHRRKTLRNTYQQWFGSKEQEREAVEAVADAPSSDPFNQLDLSDAGKRLVEALQKLPLRQQQVFMLRAWEGLDVRVTARAMGCSAGSVKTHYYRASRKLQAQLEDYWP